MAREGIMRGAMLPCTGPIGVDKAFEATGCVRFEDEAFVNGTEEVAADALDCFLMGLLRINAESGALLGRQCNVRPNHCLDVGQTPDRRLVVPSLFLGAASRITVKESGWGG